METNPDEDWEKNIFRFNGIGKHVSYDPYSVYCCSC